MKTRTGVPGGTAVPLHGGANSARSREKIKITARKAAGVMLALGVISGSAHANLVTNGSFESPVPWRGCAAGTKSLSGWTVSTGNIDIDSAKPGCDGSDLFPLFPADGIQYIDLTGSYGGGAGTIYQDLATQAGSSYELSFYFGANGQWQNLAYPNDGPIKAFNVLVDNNIVGSFSKDTRNISPNSPNWSLENLLFTATSASTRLAFVSLNGANGTVYGPLLDGVSVTEVIAPVPVPAAGWLFASALGLMGWRRKAHRA